MLQKRSFAFRSFRTQRVAFFLFSILIGFQIYLEFFYLQNEPRDIMAFDFVLQEQIDSLKQRERKDQIYPFNPNYISLSKGYQLDLSLEEIERLHRFRNSGKFANSVAEFKAVTQVSSDWIIKYSPYFKFPEWVTSKKLKVKDLNVSVIKDINTATAEELIEIRGIGAVLSKRIVKYRVSIKGFDLMEQLNQVYGLDSLVISKIKSQYQILTPAKRTKIVLAEATMEDLLRIPFLTKKEAKKIIGLRTKNKKITLKSLRNEPEFDSLKLERLALYLQ
ncbi:MAG: helix-hairpin-helix domain-containing protein [Flavobacteriaceae bacterium]|nr:helix-hairpin-helix domain-containing protein [Flavobacteriaceae bacterium]